MSQSSAETPLWWQGGTIYQVYIRSWRDSDDDGFGDIDGVVAGLDYLHWLGVDAVWLSPTMPSPDEDWGYDVSDYLGVHPELGTMAGLDRLIAEATARSIRVVLDLVPNHTSARHPWFVEARSGRTAERRDWYVWADPQNGEPPNNWLNSTGDPAWTLDGGTGQFYLHSFLEAQPDLNWWNPTVRREFERIIAFWLERGVAGFRIDVAHGLYHDRHLRDDPPGPVGTANPFGLEGVHSRNRPEVHEVYRRWRELAGRYGHDRLLLGETWVLDPEEMARYYGNGAELQLALNFAFLFCDFDPTSMRAVVERTMAALPPGACPVWAGSNHDDSRFPDRWCGGDERRTRLALSILCTLPGTTILYYGDELGLGDVEVAEQDQRDPMSWRGRAVRVNRDRARTPMPWSPGPGWGFTSPGVKPWLPFGDRKSRTVAEQRNDEGSVLLLTRALLALKGTDLTYRSLPGPDGLWMYQSGNLVVAANFTPEAVEADLPQGRCLSSLSGWRSMSVGEPVQLQPWEAVVCPLDRNAPA